MDETVSYLVSDMGSETGHAGMNPAMPEGAAILDNPYAYTDFKSDATRGARGSIFGEPTGS